MSAGSETAEYTVVFTGAFPGREPGEYLYLCGEELRRGRPPAGRLEREVEFRALPESLQGRTLEEYRRLWNLR